MSTPQSWKRRLTRAYVEIPPSPHDLSKYQPLSSSSLNRVKRVPAKENALISPSSRDTPAAHATLKRKVCNDGTQLGTSSVKKARRDNGKVLKHSLSDTGVDGFPSGFVYCHQCSQRRDPLASVQCTNITPGNKTNVKARCTTKYCKSCLKNRYGEDLSQIKIGAFSSSEATGHGENPGYNFKCPRCRDICNCSRCRKSKVQKPHDAFATHKTAASITRNPVPQQTKKEEPSARDSLYPNKPARGLSEYAITIPKWTKLHMPLGLSAVEDRIYIREFMLRFGRIMDPPISKNYLEELELIGGEFRGRDEYEGMAPWVSESCIKSMVLGILGLLTPQCHNPETVKSTTKEIRSMGTNLSKVWITLRSLRDLSQPRSSVSNNRRIHLAFPDPLPPPVSATVHQTRSMRNAENAPSNIRIHCSAQMVPVLVAFVDYAIATNAIREEIEASYRDVKEQLQRSKEAIRLEHESWERTRQALDNDVANKGKARTLKQRRLFGIDKAVDVISSNYATRFTGLLGKDDQGRLYWAISPGVEEISAARQFIASACSKESSESSGTSRRKREEQAVAAVPREYQFGEWSKILAIWGLPPEESKNRKVHEDAGDNDAEKGWWAIGEADEIRKLATWLGAHNSNIDITLSKQIADFADLLEWRNRVDRYDLNN
ncbi:hypothetical protein JOM56_002117 [Amanita muscaria]